jgi:PKD repeat protein
MKMKSMRRTGSRFLALGALLVFAAACGEDDEPTIGNAPSQSDAAFTYAASAQSDNVIEFTASNSSVSASWDFGNGATGEGTNVSASYPFAGTYTVTLTVQNSGGSASSTQDITIAQDDPNLINNPIFDLLTGGTAGPGFKSWAIDSVRAGHFGVGPDPVGAAGYFPEWYAAAALEKTGAGMYDDLYTFKLSGFGFDMITNGDVYVNTASAGIAPFNDTTATNVGDFKANFPDQLGETWTLNEGADTSITFSGNAFLGYWASSQTYQIVSISENELFLRFVDGVATNPALAWYIRLVPEGFVSNPDPVAPSYSLPLDFETVEPVFTTFGNSTAAVIANPDATGINMSSKVVETGHGNETWAGFFVNLDSKLDFSTQTTIKLKVWAPITGDFRIKLEEQANTNNFVEVDATVTTANTWEEITFDFSGTAADFDRLVMFPGWNVANAGTFYVDDIVQE